MRIVSTSLFSIGITLSSYFWSDSLTSFDLLILIALIHIATLLLGNLYKTRMSVSLLREIIKKLVYLLISLMAMIIDQVLGSSMVIFNMVNYFLIANDCLSILSIINRMNIKVPKKLEDSIKKMWGDNK